MTPSPRELRTNRQIGGCDDPITTQDAHKWTVIGRGDPVWSPANYAQNGKYGVPSRVGIFYFARMELCVVCVCIFYS